MEAAPIEIVREVEREYERMLVLPPAKHSPQWMLMPVGLIGSGKTTIVKQLATRLSLLRLCTDDVRKLLIGRGYGFEGARDIVWNLLQKYLAEGYSVALDANTGSTQGLVYNERTMKAFPRVPQVFIRIDPPESFIIAHLRENQGKEWIFKDGDAAVGAYLRNKAAFTWPNLSFAYTFDPSRNDVPQQIEEAITAIARTLEATS